MLILAIETSTLAGSVALVEVPRSGDEPQAPVVILGESTLNLSVTHSERLMPAIDRLLADVSRPVREIEGIALALGPGSFTGLRIGVSTVKGLAFALGVPVAGVGTLDALAQNVRYARGLVCPVLDARKKEVYAALYRGDGAGALFKVSEDWVLSPQALCRRIEEPTLFLGNGLEVYGDAIREDLKALANFAPEEFSLPRAVHVARLAIPLLREGKTLDLFSFTPIYLRRSDAEIGRGTDAAPPSPSGWALRESATEDSGKRMD
jgi:tRNA threonylcarbamoyladenosine biosynthesis protein TsaB